MSSSVTQAVIPESRPPSRLAYGGLLLIAVAAFAAYANSFEGPFVLDDIDAIAKNVSIRRLGAPREVLWGATFATVVGRPLLNLSLAINYALHGLDVRGYHLFNVLAHILAAWALFGVVHRTLRLPQYRESFSPQSAIGFATAAALLWSVHPLATAAVTYTVQRSEVMMAGFFLATLYCVIRGTDSPCRSLWNVLAVGCCLLGVMTKEVIVTAPLLVLLYDRSFLAGSWRSALRQRRSLYLGLFATWIALALLMKSSEGRSGTAGLGYGMRPLDYASSQFGYVLTYLKLAVWPHPLIFDYGDVLTESWQEVLVPGLLLWLLGAVLVVASRKRPAVEFLGIAPLLILAPTSTIVPLVTQTAGEHRMYLPLAAVVALIVLAGWKLTEKLFGPGSSWKFWSAIGSVAVVACVFGALTHVRNRDYRTEFDLWLDTVQKWPRNARAHNNLGRLYLETQDHAAAQREFELSLKIKRDNPAAWHNLGLAFWHRREFESALESLNEAIDLRPQHVPSLYLRAMAHGRLDNSAEKNADLEQTLAILNATIALSPTDAAAYYQRALVHGQLGHNDAELADLDRTIAHDPSQGAAYIRRAIAHMGYEKHAAAWRDIRTAQRLGTEPPAGLVELLKEASDEPPP